MSTFWYSLGIVCLPRTALGGLRALTGKSGGHLFLDHFEDGVDHGFDFVGKSESEGAIARLHLNDNSVGRETLPVSDHGQGVVEVDDAADGLAEPVGHLLVVG